MERDLGDPGGPLPRTGLTRAAFVRRAGGFGLALSVLGPLLAACGDSDDSGSSSSSSASSAAPDTAAASSAEASSAAATSAAETSEATSAESAASDTGAGTEAALSEGQPGGTLTFARNQDVQTLNPMLAFENGSIWVIPQLFEGLVDVRYGQKTPQPAIAESWTTSDDGIEWTFKLRSGPTFSDGTPVTAEDVIFSISRFADEKVNANYYGEGRNIASVEAVDDATVLIKLKQTDGSILDNLAMFVPMIVPKKLVEQLGDEAFGQKPVGSGPFMLESWDAGVQLTLVKNPHYWRENRPYLDKLVVAYVPDDNTRGLQLESGDSQVAAAIPHSQVDRLKDTDGIDVLVEPYYAWNTLLLRNTLAPLDDKNVRQALAHATPRETILEKVLFGYADLATSQIGPNLYNSPDVAPYPYDVDKAKELMAASKAPQGFELKLDIASGNSISSQIAQVLQQEWAELGVKLTIQEFDFGTAIDNWYTGKSQALLTPPEMLSSDTLSNDELSFILYVPEACCDSFFTGYDNPQAATILNEANGSLDDATRQAKFYELQALTMDDMATIPLFDTLARTGLRDEVQNFHTVPTGWWNLDDVWLKQ